MITNSGRAIAMAVPRWPLCRHICCASTTINSEHLRSQLDQLQAEAETTRTKLEMDYHYDISVNPMVAEAANNARLRLLRLSEKAEKFQKQAAISVQKGKENGAREIFFQRKKVLQALEKSKTRIQLLDELFTKLCEEGCGLLWGFVFHDCKSYETLVTSQIYCVNVVPFAVKESPLFWNFTLSLLKSKDALIWFQAISSKESQLIGHVSLNIEDKTEDCSSPVRIISPKEECGKDIIDNDLDSNVMKSLDIQDVGLSVES